MHLKPGWEINVLAIKPKVYLLGIKTKCLVNKTFDKMQCLNRLKYSTLHILFSFSVFVFYKTNEIGEQKRCAVINIHKLNDPVIPDIYLLSLQSDIIASV